MILSTVDIVAPTRRVVFFSLLSAGLSVAGTGVGSFNRPVDWTALLTGFVVASAGFQIATARRIFGLTAPREIRRWMLPVSFACYVVGATLALLGLRALFSRWLFDERCSGQTIY